MTRKTAALGAHSCSRCAQSIAGTGPCRQYRAYQRE